MYSDIPWTSRKLWIINSQSLLHFPPDFPFSPDFRNGRIQTTYVREINASWNVPVLVSLYLLGEIKEQKNYFFKTVTHHTC